MLYKVEIDNYFSISEPQVIDLRARRSVEDIQGRLPAIYEGSKIRGPNVVALYGPNASGKSNVLRAIAFGSWFVVDSFDQKAGQFLPYEKFGKHERIAAPTRLAFSFTGPVDFLRQPGDGQQCPYKYEFVLSPRGHDSDSVVHERLSYRPKGYGKAITLIERQQDKAVRYARGFMTPGHATALKAVLRPDASAISTLAQLENEPAMNMVLWMLKIQTNILIDRIEGDEVVATRWYAVNQPALDQLRAIGRSIDLGIDQIDVDQSVAEPRLRFRHSGLDQVIDLYRESHGTRQFIKLFPWIQSALGEGSIAMIDDIDSAIHPHLLPEIARWFTEKESNPNGAQLWMTCHSPSLMNEMTKEGILFCEKDSQGRSSIYRLAEVEGVRRGENFYGKYMGGEYGAVPRFG